jgi:hypothetical protein
MPKEDKPLEYQKRVRDTRTVAQRIDLEYLKRTGLRGLWRRRMSWMLPAAALVISLPLLLGIGGAKKALSSGPVSRAHAIFESRCENCHSQPFAKVPDRACQRCHDGPAHPAKVIDAGMPVGTPRCAVCHVEHRGNVPLAAVRDSHCTACHSDLKDHGTGVRLQSVAITRFRPGQHPDFPAAGRQDLRPLQLNHTVHMQLQANKYPAMKLPMKCSDCHATNPDSAKGDLLPVTFDKNCRSCHSAELQFDVYQLLPPLTAAPHTEDPVTIQASIEKQYRDLLARDPAIVHRPLPNELTPIGNEGAWLSFMVEKSEKYLFENKCIKCHRSERFNGIFPVVKKVGEIRGQYVEGQRQGRPWLERAEFSHRAHRAVDCSSCHTAAKTSKLTSDILIPKMQNCTPCHGASGTAIDNCAQCHLYHNKSKETDKDRRPVEQLISKALPWP